MSMKLGQTLLPPNLKLAHLDLILELDDSRQTSSNNSKASLIILLRNIN